MKITLKIASSIVVTPEEIKIGGNTIPASLIKSVISNLHSENRDV